MGTRVFGQRSYAPAVTHEELQPVTRSELLQAATLAGKALQLTSSVRHVLTQLCAVYGNEMIEGKILVWPSNEYLCENSGISERSIRYALRQLIDLGLINAKDSANGKRFAQRSRDGKIIKAFGFDLGPLMARQSEFHKLSYLIEAAKRERSAKFDELTMERRTVRGILAEIDAEDLMERFVALMGRLPRRGSLASPEPFIEEWRQLRIDAEERYKSASGGNNCRHIDNNKDFNFCKGASEESQAATLRISDLAAACPDAMEYFEDIRTEQHLISGVVKMRGAFGVSNDAWEEARDSIGGSSAAAAFLYVMQMQARPAVGSQPIANFGGYFRSVCRMIKSGKFDLPFEIRRLLLRKLKETP